MRLFPHSKKIEILSCAQQDEFRPRPYCINGSDKCPVDRATDLFAAVAIGLGQGRYQTCSRVCIVVLRMHEAEWQNCCFLACGWAATLPALAVLDETYLFYIKNLSCQANFPCNSSVNDVGRGHNGVHDVVGFR